MKKYQELNQIKNHKSVCLIGHINPDPDAISSMVVLREFIIKHFNIEKVDIFAETSKLSDNIKLILGDLELCQENFSYDVAIMMDSPNSERLGKFKPLFESSKLKIVIDHHATNNYSGNINFVEICSSTCEIIYSILSEYNYEISTENQGKLYAGIIADTNNFGVGEISSRTFKIASEFNQNIDRETIYKTFLLKSSLKNMQLLSCAIKNIDAYEDNKIIITHISHKEAKKLNASLNDFHGIINNIATINSSLMVCLIEPRDNFYYVSMRAKQNYNVASIAKKYGGGGHVGAAAFNSNEKLKNIKKIILNEFSSQVRSVKSTSTKPF